MMSFQQRTTNSGTGAFLPYQVGYYERAGDVCKKKGLLPTGETEFVIGHKTGGSTTITLAHTSTTKIQDIRWTGVYTPEAEKEKSATADSTNLFGYSFDGLTASSLRVVQRVERKASTTEIATAKKQIQQYLANQVQMTARALKTTRASRTSESPASHALAQPPQSRNSIQEATSFPTSDPSEGGLRSSIKFVAQLKNFVTKVHRPSNGLRQDSSLESTPRSDTSAVDSTERLSVSVRVQQNIPHQRVDDDDYELFGPPSPSSPSIDAPNTSDASSDRQHSPTTVTPSSKARPSPSAKVSKQQSQRRWPPPPPPPVETTSTFQSASSSPNPAGEDTSSSTQPTPLARTPSGMTKSSSARSLPAGSPRSPTAPSPRQSAQIDYRSVLKHRQSNTNMSNENSLVTSRKSLFEGNSTRTVETSPSSIEVPPAPVPVPVPAPLQSPSRPSLASSSPSKRQFNAAGTNNEAPLTRPSSRSLQITPPSPPKEVFVRPSPPRTSISFRGQSTSSLTAPSPRETGFPASRSPVRPQTAGPGTSVRSIPTEEAQSGALWKKPSPPASGSSRTVVTDRKSSKQLPQWPPPPPTPTNDSHTQLSSSGSSLSGGKMFYPLSALQTPPFPPDVDSSIREEWLSDEDFQQTFRMSKADFSALPKWKQQNLKKQKGLY